MRERESERERARESEWEGARRWSSPEVKAVDLRSSVRVGFLQLLLVHLVRVSEEPASKRPELQQRWIHEHVTVKEGDS